MLALVVAVPAVEAPVVETQPVVEAQRVGAPPVETQRVEAQAEARRPAGVLLAVTLLAGARVAHKVVARPVGVVSRT